MYSTCSARVERNGGATRKRGEKSARREAPEDEAQRPRAPRAGRAPRTSFARRASRLASGAGARGRGAFAAPPRGVRSGARKRKSQQAARPPRTADSARERAPRGLHTRRAPRVTAGRVSHVATYTPAGARRKRGLAVRVERRANNETTMRRRKAPPHPPRVPCSSAAARTASLRNARVARRRARVASCDDAHDGRGGPLCAEREATKKERHDNDRPKDSKAYRTPPRSSSQLRPSPHPPCASAEAAACR